MASTGAKEVPPGMTSLPESPEVDGERCALRSSAALGFCKWVRALGLRFGFQGVLDHLRRCCASLLNIVGGNFGLGEFQQTPGVVAKVGATEDWLTQGCVAHLGLVLRLGNTRPTSRPPDTPDAPTPPHSRWQSVVGYGQHHVRQRQHKEDEL